MKFAGTIVDVPKEKRVKTFYSFQYKMERELKRFCPNFVFQQVTIPQRVIDFEDKFTRPEIDSIENVCLELSKSKKVYIYIVTVDDFFPDSNIEEFSNRNREHWGNRSYEKGTILIVMSTTKRQSRISTGYVSTQYAPDVKCSEITKIMSPYFKQREYFNGILRGLDELKKIL